MKLKILQFLAIFIISIIFFTAQLVYADVSSWTQNDWRGGSGQISWSDSSKYYSTSSISVSASGLTISTNSGWYNPLWKYRQSVSITNNSGSTLTNYQIPIYLNTSQLITNSKMKADCSDIRIVDASGNLVPLWIASAPTADTCNHTATKLWVKLSSLPTPSTTLYLYYGNNDATTVSNGESVFPIFADFTTGSTLPNTWTKKDIGTSGTATVGNGVLTITNTNGEDVWTRIYGGTHVYSTSTVTGSFIAETLINSQTNSDPWAKTGISIQNSVASGVANGQAFIITTPGNGIAFQYQSTLPADACVGGCTAPNTQTNGGSFSFPLFLKLTKNSSNQVSGFYSTNSTSWTQRGITSTPDGVSDTQYVSLIITPHNLSGTSTSTYSFFYTRSYTASEPTVGSWQSEQKPYDSSANMVSSIFDTGNATDFGILTYSYTSATNTSVTVKMRTSNNSDMSGATDFGFCDTISSGSDISSNNCVTDRMRYIQYQISLASSDNLYSPTFQSINLAYVPTPTYTLDYSASANGSITGSTTQMVYSGNNGSAVTAVAATGYNFIDWSDSSTTNPRTDTNITANISVTANFADITSPIITNVSAAPSSKSALISWSVDSAASGRVRYGLSTSYGSQQDDATFTTSHAIGLSELKSCTTYYYEVSSADAADNRTTNSGNRFTTIGCGSFFSPPSPPQVVTVPVISKNKITYGVNGANQIAVSDNPSFAHSSWETYSENYDFSKFDGRTVYVKFSSPQGGETPVYTLNAEQKNSLTTATISSPDFVFKKNLARGMTNSDVKELQKYLNNHGFRLANSGAGSPRQETNYFGSLLQNALIKFQKANNIKPAIGYFGAITRKIINK